MRWAEHTYSQKSRKTDRIVENGMVETKSVTVIMFLFFSGEKTSLHFPPGM